MASFDLLSKVPFRTKVQVLIGCLIVRVIFFRFDIDRFDTEDVENFLSNCASLRSWPLISPFFAAYVLLGDWLLGDTTTVPRHSWSRDLWGADGVFAAWNPGDTVLVLSVLVRCGILFVAARYLFRLCGARVSELAAAVSSKAVTVCSDFLTPAVLAHEQGLVFLDALLVASCVFLVNMLCLQILLVLISIHWVNGRLIRCNDSLKKYRISQLARAVPRTTDTGTDRGTETPPFWNDGLCSHEAVVCDTIRRDLYSVLDTRKFDLANQQKSYNDSLRTLKYRDQELRSEYKEQIKIANNELRKLGVNQTALEAIADLEEDLADAEREIADHRRQMREMRERNEAIAARHDRSLKGYQKMLNIARNQDPASEAMVPKSRLDRLQKDRDSISKRWATQREIAEELRRTNAALRRRLEWARYDVTIPYPRAR